MLKVFLRSSIDGVCVDALALAMIIMSGTTFDSLAAMLSRSGRYLLIFLTVASLENLSLFCLWKY